MGDGDGAQGFRILQADATSHVGTHAFLFWPFSYWFRVRKTKPQVSIVGKQPSRHTVMTSLLGFRNCCCTTCLYSTARRTRRSEQNVTPCSPKRNIGGGAKVLAAVAVEGVWVRSRWGVDVTSGFRLWGKRRGVRETAWRFSNAVMGRNIKVAHRFETSVVQLPGALPCEFSFTTWVPSLSPGPG